MSEAKDQTTDLSGRERTRLQQAFEAPNFVKQASVEDACGDAALLAATAYGDPIHRLYPCHTKAATWLSAAFFAETATNEKPALRDVVQQRIKHAAQYWGIAPDIDALFDRIARSKCAEEESLADSDFALVWRTNDKTQRHFPLRNASEVKAASAWFEEYHKEFSFDDKHTVAKKILEKAAAYGASVDGSELLHRCAGFGYCDPNDIADAWELRGKLVKRANHALAEQMQVLANTVREHGVDVTDHGLRVKMASMLDQCDRENGIRVLYDRDGVNVERPEDVVFHLTEKVASDFLRDHVQTTTGAVYEKAAIAAINPELVREHLGDDIADELDMFPDPEKVADIVATLPRGDAEIFERLAKAEGILPVGTEKTAVVAIDWAGLAAAARE